MTTQIILHYMNMEPQRHYVKMTKDVGPGCGSSYITCDFSSLKLAHQLTFHLALSLHRKAYSESALSVVLYLDNIWVMWKGIVTFELENSLALALIKPAFCVRSRRVRARARQKCVPNLTWSPNIKKQLSSAHDAVKYRPTRCELSSISSSRVRYRNRLHTRDECGRRFTEAR